MNIQQTNFMNSLMGSLSIESQKKLETLVDYQRKTGAKSIRAEDILTAHHKSNVNISKCKVLLSKINAQRSLLEEAKNKCDDIETKLDSTTLSPQELSEVERKLAEVEARIKFNQEKSSQYDSELADKTELIIGELTKRSELIKNIFAAKEVVEKKENEYEEWKMKGEIYEGLSSFHVDVVRRRVNELQMEINEAYSMLNSELCARTSLG